jgi:lipid-A-disaccharide synthase
MDKKSVLLLAGEASGDYHAAALVRDIKSKRPDIRFTGIGGDLLAQAGMELLVHYRDVNTIGLGEGLGKLRQIWGAYKTMRDELLSGRHSLFIPVDFPDVNLRLCGFAKKAKVPVYYFISPQIWAWRKGRIKKIAARVERMMTIFPFEEKLYRSAGVRADFVGHTMIRDMPEIKDREGLRVELGLGREKYVVALVPGSRPAEVRRILPRMCAAAQIYRTEFPETEFALPLAGEHLAAPVNEILSDYQELKVKVLRGEAAKLMAAADSGLVTSGTATLQAALVGMPHAVVYVLDKLTWIVALRVIKPLLMDEKTHVAMANVLALNAEDDPDSPIPRLMERGIKIPCQECSRALFVPELLQHAATPENLASWLNRFRTETALVEGLSDGFKWIRRSLTGSEAKSAASIVLDFFDK